MALYQTLLGVRSVTAPSPTEVHLEYDVEGSEPVFLMLAFDPTTKALVAADVSRLLPSSVLICHCPFPVYGSEKYSYSLDYSNELTIRSTALISTSANHSTSREIVMT